VEWCVSMRRLGFVCCGFVGRRLRGNGERLCGCRKSQGYGHQDYACIYMSFNFK